MGSLQRNEDGFAGDAFMLGYRPQNAVQRAHAQGTMLFGHGQTMMGWFPSLQDNVTARLMHLPVTPVPATKVSRDFQVSIA